MAFNKKISVLLATLIVSSLAMACLGGTQAQSLPKPSVPEFTLKYTIQSSDVPGATPTYTIDPYTGQQKIETPGSSGYHLDTRTVEIKITNQPYTAHVDGSNYVALYYNVSYKGPYENDWHYYHRTGQSTSDYTLINFTDVPNDGGTIEFRLQAQIGYYTEYHMPFVDYYFTGEVSGWSSTQAVDIPAVSPTPTSLSPTPTSVITSPTSNTPESAPESQTTWLMLGAIAALSAVVAVLILAVAFMYRKIRGLELKQMPHKTLTSLCLISLMLIMVLSCFAAVHAQSSTPSFTARVIDDSYIIPYRNVTSTDPYTGKTTWLIEGGGHVENQKIVVTIKNPAYSPVALSDGNITELRYSIRTKGHYQDWQAEQNYTSPHYTYAIKASGTAETVMTYYLQGEPGWESLLPNGGQVDVEVRAIIGYTYVVTNYNGMLGSSSSEAFVQLAAADWSSPQTVTVPKELKNPLPDWWTGPTPEPEPSTAPDNTAPIDVPMPSVIPTQTPDPEAVGNPVTAPSQSSDQSASSPQDWLAISAFAALGLAVAWIAAYLALTRKRTKTSEEGAT